MYKTLNIHFVNGMQDDDSVTLYVTILKGADTWALFLAYETNGGGKSFAEVGGISFVPSGDKEQDFWASRVKSAIWDMLTPTDDEEGLEYDGGWSDMIEDAQFDPDQWIDHPN